jgi:Coenzyme PQQ synthesis protein D (PqqD)
VTAVSEQAESQSAGLRYRKAGDVHEKTIGETFFLFTPRGGFYGFDGVGRNAWDLIVAGHTMAEIVDELSAQFDADVAAVRADVAEFVRDIRSQGLVEPITDAGGAAVAADVSPETT